MLAFPQGFFFSEKMTSLEIFDMYLMIFDRNSQYLVRFNQYLSKFININQYLWRYLIPGVGQILKLFFGTPRVSQQSDWVILTHWDCRCDYYKQVIVVYRKSRNVIIFSSSRIWDFDGISPPGSAVQTRRIHPLGQISQFHHPGLIMKCRENSELSITDK